jgi:hypothetical protein
MQYLLLIYEDPSERERLDADAEAEILPAYRAFAKAIQESRHFVAANRLEPPSTATTIRIRAGRRLITDGPFAETKEQLLGYFAVEAADLDEALDIASGIPTAASGRASRAPRPTSRAGSSGRPRTSARRAGPTSSSAS